ncbi:TM0106 family RecB-like putative nuclease [Legionella sp. W05-934-2]|uniref:TM0106 family RecB-like putative nuclease n=1 Tax=Legionella sp. W05-934-2 TaxID=1198649 RepID=UPI00346313B2
MDDLLEVSPSLFFKYAKSPHWIWYDIHGDQSKKEELPELTKKLIEGGVLHEEEYVDNLQKITIDESLSEEEAEQQTLQYMEDGAELIYQGVISYIDGDVKYKGRPDFLKKCEGLSNFGNYFYMPIEIKNSTNCEKPAYKKQLMLYAIILKDIQNFIPPIGKFINKYSEEIACELSEKIKQSTNNTIGEILSILRGKEPPLKISKAALESPWKKVLLNEAIEKSDLSLIYNIRSDVLKGLKQQGISTLDNMAECDIESFPKIKGAGPKTLERIHKQAKSLVNNEIIRISKPDIPEAEIKIYFDIESDPLLGVEYLFGFLIVKPHSVPEFKYFLAETPENEKDMWAEFLAWLNTMSLDNVRIYHYHSYEKTQLNKLSKKYGGSHQLIQFISKLVDLLKTTRDSFIFPVYFYSIKDIAKYLGFSWQHEKAGGAQSVFWYEKWLETKDRTILQDIIDYNEDDVRATEFMHQWLNKHK